VAIDLGIPFPSEAEALRQHAREERDLSPAQRLKLADDLTHTAITLSKAGGVYPAAIKRHEALEAEWRQRMLEFIAKHGATSSR
jgi:hypothetical protein